MNKKDLLENSETFCMLPWIHLHTWPTGDAYPCCMAPSETPLGNQEDHSYQELFNVQSLKDLRVDLLNGNKSEFCTKCYELEDSGVDSYRFWANTMWGHHFNAVEKMEKDGTITDVKIPYIDFRFSNQCNLRCRTCGPELSSGWTPDHEKAWGLEKGSGPGLIRPKRDLDVLYAELEPLLDDLEEIYFAGGEPLIMDEHYYILDMLIKKGKTDVKVRYNTNFTKFTYNGNSAFDYWNKFKNVRIDASLDGSGERGEYLRKGLNWNKVEENIVKLKTKCPHVEFGISPTLSVFNALHIVDFHNYMVDKGFINYHQININILLGPEKFRIQILPKSLKAECVKQIEAQIDHLTKVGHINDSTPNTLRYIIEQYKTVISYLNKKDPYDHLIGKFNFITQTLDDIRKESFLETFPELKGLQDE